MAAAWYRHGRVHLLERIAAYLEQRAASGHLSPVPDFLVQARIVLETLTMWSVHRLGDPAPQALDEEGASALLVRFVSSGLLAGTSP